MPQFSVFFKEWDQCIDDWFQNPSNLTGRLKSFQNVGCSLCYLPEPYYGDPECCSAVVININPGSSSPDEHVKEWPNQNNPSDFLIYDFAHKYSGNYFNFQKDYSPFVAPPTVPGVEWWRNNRNDFIRRIINLYNHFKNRSFDSGKVPFAMELCPLHSRTTASINFSKKCFRSVYLKNVFFPASFAILNSSIPFGLGFSSTLCKIMQTKEAGNFKIIYLWKNGVDLNNRLIPNWPVDNVGYPKKRTYALLKSTDLTYEGENIDNPSVKNQECPVCYFLITWDQSGSIIKIGDRMMKEYASVDEQVVKYISNLI